MLMRGLDTANELSDWVAQKISAAIDPREKLLRRRRRALRWGLIFAAGCVFWGVVTAILAAWGWFALLLEITGGGRGRAGDDRYAAADSLPLAAIGATARAAAHQRPTPATAEFGGTVGDIGAGSLRTGILLVTRRYGAGQHVARQRDS
jgi:hypothetical protein